ncbi:hypothetical protein MILUP08_41979 [Micromonospora lupini str. Lupac 08]|uniref:Uncharacterized protein n=1 Tax=Micromonospora lupini str. Lupac 08 TaxID=1150864 RepID=I0KZR3_9ACTN|nr:hypothetical protein MILUP08_41979 [Micromonospora lupini str. Lupac 08]
MSRLIAQIELPTAKALAATRIGDRDGVLITYLAGVVDGYRRVGGRRRQRVRQGLLARRRRSSPSPSYDRFRALRTAGMTINSGRVPTGGGHPCGPRPPRPQGVHIPVIHAIRIQ